MAMKKMILTLCIAGISGFSKGQVSEHSKLIELGKTYKGFMFRNVPSKDVLKEIKSDLPPSLMKVTDFIIQTITTKNQLLSKAYLTRPDDQVLKQIYVVRALSHNLSEEEPLDERHLIDSLMSTDISTYELLDTYYGMIFTAVGNKNQPFDLSKIDFKMKEFNFKDETEKGIMFLRCVDFCGKSIWGFMNVVKPPNTAKAIGYIKKFPKFNGQPYYQYADFGFSDFEMVIIKDKGIQSYKHYYLDKFYEVLLSHFVCLNREGSSNKEINDLLLGSILRERKLYKYTKYKDVLEDLFKEKKRD